MVEDNNSSFTLDVAVGEEVVGERDVRFAVLFPQPLELRLDRLVLQLDEQFPVIEPAGVLGLEQVGGNAAFGGGVRL